MVTHSHSHAEYAHRIVLTASSLKASARFSDSKEQEHVPQLSGHGAAQFFPPQALQFYQHRRLTVGIDPAPSSSSFWCGTSFPTTNGFRERKIFIALTARSAFQVSHRYNRRLRLSHSRCDAGTNPGSESGRPSRILSDDSGDREPPIPRPSVVSAISRSSSFL